MIIKQLSLLSVLPAAAFSVLAQNNIAESNMVVTANRVQQPINTVLAPISVVTREEINRWQSKTLTDVMRRLPGVDIGQNGGIGQKSSLFIRGTNSSHVLVLVDGIRLNQAGISGSSDLSQFPLSLVQRVEYIRGPRSAIYGSDAIGGVVNIITESDHVGTNLTAGFGSKGYQNYDAVTQQKLGDSTRIALAGNYTYSKGFDVVASGSYGDQRQPDSDGFMSKTLFGSVHHTFSDQFSGFFRGYGYDNRTDYDGYANNGTLVDTRKLYSQTWDTGLNFHHNIFHSQLISSYGHSKDYNFDPRKGRYDKTASLDNVKQYNVQSINSIDVGKGNIGAGLDWQKQSAEPGTHTLTNAYIQHNTGIYLTGLQSVSDFTFEGAVRNDNNSQFGHHGTWQGSTAWDFVEGYRFVASYGTAFKAPNFGQLYSGWGGNSQLKPEKSRQWEGAFEGLTAGVNWRVSGYHNDIENLIDSTNDTGWQYYNTAKARIKGIEATAAFDTGLFGHELGYDYVDARNGETRQLLPRRAKQQVKYQLNWQVQQLDWSLTYHYLGIRHDTDYSTYQPVKMGGVSLWDIAVSYPVTSQLTIHGKIANMFDKDYETAYGYQTSRREYYLSGGYAF